VFIIGIDPHKGSHTAAVIDRDEQVLGELSVHADRRQRDRLLAWAAPFAPRFWAVEGATGHGALLAQQLVASGETVVDVPAALSARARLLDVGRKDKTDSHDARSAAIVALRHRNLRAVTLEDQRQVLRLLARRHHQLTAARTRAICRLHAVLAEMIEGGCTDTDNGAPGRSLHNGDVFSKAAHGARRDARGNYAGDCPCLTGHPRRSRTSNARRSRASGHRLQFSR
jgi:transposase